MEEGFLRTILKQCPWNNPSTIAALGALTLALFWALALYLLSSSHRPCWGPWAGMIPQSVCHLSRTPQLSGYILPG